MLFVLGAPLEIVEIGSTFQSGNEGNLVCKGTMGRDIFGICWNRIPVTWFHATFPGSMEDWREMHFFVIIITSLAAVTPILPAFQSCAKNADHIDKINFWILREFLYLKPDYLTRTSVLCPVPSLTATGLNCKCESFALKIWTLFTGWYTLSLHIHEVMHEL